MKQCYFSTTITFSLSLFTCFVCAAFLGGCATVSKKQQDKNLREQYQEYRGHARAGQAAIKKEKYLEAIELFTKAIAMSPFEASHYYYRGLAWYRHGNVIKAIEDFDNVLALDSRWRLAYMYRGLCRMKSKDYEKALKDYKRALSLKADEPTIHNNLAWLYATAEDEKYQDKVKALEHAKKASELSKERNAEILDTLARVYFINGKVKEAIEAQEKALKLRPYNEEFKNKLEEYEKASWIDK